MLGASEKLLSADCDIVGQVSSDGRHPSPPLRVQARYKQSAASLNFTPRTVAFPKYRMTEQLKVKSTAELVQYVLSSTTSCESARAQTRVLLVDDNQAIVSRARAVLAPACLVVGQAHDGEGSRPVRCGFAAA